MLHEQACMRSCTGCGPGAGRCGPLSGSEGLVPCVPRLGHSSAQVVFYRNRLSSPLIPLCRLRQEMRLTRPLTLSSACNDRLDSSSCVRRHVGQAMFTICPCRVSHMTSGIALQPQLAPAFICPVSPVLVGKWLGCGTCRGYSCTLGCAASVHLKRGQRRS